MSYSAEMKNGKRNEKALVENMCKLLERVLIIS
jgi:hypothetical protein